MLEYNEVKEHKYIIFEDEPYEVLSSHVFRKQQRKPVNATKLRNLLTGNISEISFHQSEKVEEAEIGKKEVKFVYQSRGEYWFQKPDDPKERFKIDQSLIGESAKFLKGNSLINVIVYNDAIIGVKLPIKVELKVTEAPPAVKGETAKW